MPAVHGLAAVRSAALTRQIVLGARARLGEDLQRHVAQALMPSFKLKRRIRRR
jgi:hypothetical protein